jgi:hypothetical protein
MWGLAKAAWAKRWATPMAKALARPRELCSVQLLEQQKVPAKVMEKSEYR